MAWTVTDDGLEIYYEDTGKGDVLVFQSGYRGIMTYGNIRSAS